MKLFAGLCASLLLVFSSVGCCMSSCVGSCDPCGRELCGGGFGGGGSCGKSCGSSCGGCGLGGCLSKLFHHRCHKCHPMYAGYGWDAYSGCGGDVCYDGCNTTYGASDCACGHPHGGPAQMMPAAPPQQMAPAPVPAAIDPMGARYAPSRPAYPQAAPQAAPQQVSYEEFQRLPGVQQSAPAAAAPPTLVPPVAGQPANWAAR
ncbi:MAG: hypothetical protein SH850_01210 [Planctomycetaceae bacterium]|nr:hypothetical protein [Planctomycetaceae bacterium]